MQEKGIVHGKGLGTLPGVQPTGPAEEGHAAQAVGNKGKSFYLDLGQARATGDVTPGTSLDTDDRESGRGNGRTNRSEKKSWGWNLFTLRGQGSQDRLRRPGIRSDKG